MSQKIICMPRSFGVVRCQMAATFSTKPRDYSLFWLVISDSDDPSTLGDGFRRWRCTEAESRGPTGDVGERRESLHRDRGSDLFVRQQLSGGHGAVRHGAAQSGYGFAAGQSSVQLVGLLLLGPAHPGVQPHETGGDRRHGRREFSGDSLYRGDCEIAPSRTQYARIPISRNAPSRVTTA